ASKGAILSEYRVLASLILPRIQENAIRIRRCVARGGFSTWFQNRSHRYRGVYEQLNIVGPKIGALQSGILESESVFVDQSSSLEDLHGRPHPQLLAFLSDGIKQTLRTSNLSVGHSRHASAASVLKTNRFYPHWRFDLRHVIWLDDSTGAFQMECPLRCSVDQFYRLTCIACTTPKILRSQSSSLLSYGIAVKPAYAKSGFLIHYMSRLVGIW
ncbi:hypothetical protein EV401DRAFT_1886650, partial [Pisolithus croceorrhizus]